MKKPSTRFTMAIFLLGIAMGALDSGIVSPARNIIAGGLNVSQSSSIWMITIYTLAYAVSMPILGKLADRFGRKNIYLFSIFLFGLGSLFCGLADYFNSYSMLLTSRVIEAIGGGGIMPIATSYVGTSFPKEKRGMALGIIGAIYGICTVIGPTLGSGILQLCGDNNWGYLFFINVPISIIVIFMALRLENSTNKESKKMDFAGCVSLTVVILSLMYFLTNLKFDNLGKSITSLDVWPYIIIFIISIPVFVWIEKRAEDPVMNLRYFTNKNIALLLVLSLFVSFGLMAVIFLPQFSENVLKLPAGSGGYYSTIFAVFMGFASPFSGKLIDKIGAKKVTIIGFGLTVIGALYEALITCYHPNITNLIIGVALLGFGTGFSFGTPMNYLMLSYVPDSEATLGQSTISLFRSIGVAVAPNILINFVATAGKNVPTAISKVMPKVQGMHGAATSSASGASSNMATAFQNANVHNIFGLIQQMATNQFAAMHKAIAHNPAMLSHFGAIESSYMSSLTNARTAIEHAFQYTLNMGYSKMFLTSAVISIIAFCITFALKEERVKKEPKAN